MNIADIFSNNVEEPSYDDPTNWAAQQEELVSALKRAQQLQQPTSRGPGGIMVGGRYIPVGAADDFMQGMNILAGQQQAAAAMKSMQKLQSAQYKHAADWMNSRPTGGPNIEFSNEIEPSAPGLSIPQKPSPQEMLQWSQTGMLNPLTKTMAALQMRDTMVEAPIREDKQRFQSEEAAAKRAEAGALARAQIEARMAEGAANRDLRRDLNTSSQDLRRELAQSNIESRAQQGEANRALRLSLAQNSQAAGADKLSAKERAEIDKYEAAVSGLSGAISALKAMPRDPSLNSGAASYVSGLVQDIIPGGSSLVQSMRPKEVNAAVQQLTYVSDAIRHERFGSALSKHEKSSAHQYLPSPYDKREQLIAKAEGLQQLLELNNKRLREKTGSAISTNDIRSSGYSGGSRAAANAESISIIENELSQPGLSQQDVAALNREIARLKAQGASTAPEQSATIDSKPTVSGASQQIPRIRKWNPTTGVLE